MRRGHDDRGLAARSARPARARRAGRQAASAEPAPPVGGEERAHVGVEARLHERLSLGQAHQRREVGGRHLASAPSNRTPATR
ncbi:MAG: hypothetical protein MZV64_13780 [Ignavibacteriales bacterium]|nr:hypothetical protein [Ignavibacteriales bacterium]